MESKKEPVISVLINNQIDRENIVIALANSGYKIWVDETKDTMIGNTNYYVKFIYL